ncbi:MAG TPA: hypothetical protein VET24_10520, partial [Actinomycetota bacterium]|nr:hypothetical protein [Actinomycetota bacterium]
MGFGGEGGSVQATMQQFPLTITHILRHGATVFGDTEVATFDGERVRQGSFAGVAARAGRLAAALARLG